MSSIRKLKLKPLKDHFNPSISEGCADFLRALISSSVTDESIENAKKLHRVIIYKINGGKWPKPFAEKVEARIEPLIRSKKVSLKIRISIPWPMAAVKDSGTKNGK